MKNLSNHSARLTKAFFKDTDVVSLARSLLGNVLCTNFSGVLTSGIIVETEAYKAPGDKASHAYNNRRTARTEVMFGPPGHAYVYLCYGIHHLFNVVTGPAETAHAILIRAIEPLEGIEHMLVRRKMTKSTHKLSAGPGSLSQALGLDKSHTGLSLTDEESIVWIESKTSVKKVLDKDLIASPRVGVGYSGECAHWPWRFRIRDNPWTSPAK